MTKRWIVPLAGLALLAACGGDKKEPDDKGTPTPTKKAGIAVGAITDSFPTLNRNGEEAFSGDGLASNDSLETSSGGAAAFKLNKNTLRCQLRRETSVVILPAETPDVLMQVKKASANTPVTCSAKAGQVHTFMAGNALIASLDPVFSIAIEDNLTTVRVWRGFVNVWNSAMGTGSTQLLGPLQQSTIPADGPPAQADTMQADRAQVRDFAALTPRSVSDLRRPNAGNSTTLSTAYERGSLIVGYDPETTPDPVVRFLTLLGDDIEKRWSLKVELKTFGTADAGAARDSDQLDLFVSTAQEAGDGSVPIVRQPDDDSVWRLNAISDPGFVDAFDRWLVAYLDSGAYGTPYTRVFDQTPAYEIFKDLVA